jgi:hypothetical protein
MIGAATTVISIGLFLFAAKMKTQHEEWKPIAECNGEYHISNQGRVKSFKYGKERILKPAINSSGYWYIFIFIKNEKPKFSMIHKLMAVAFISNPENKKEVNHKDGNKLNNNLCNLEWVTHSENMKHAWDNGLFKSKIKKF